MRFCTPWSVGMASPSVDRQEHFRALQRRSARARSVAAVERRIRELVESGPPLTNEQRARLAVLLGPTSDAA